ncbi:hypothetical protein G6F50_017247 [Rhizopus delemar]|uniref:Uncharacterized protein n=1 Tax=Rhizopus delemar TaxID=936053 RepID=A0A9P6XQK1_9FUNG|nr:hypothetical protein G6F50_017247 [Rhizopus delemar]
MRADVDLLNATNFYTDRLFGLWVSVDMLQPDRTAPYLVQGGLGMPDHAAAGRRRRPGRQGAAHPRAGDQDRAGACHPGRNQRRDQGRQPLDPG